MSFTNIIVTNVIHVWNLIMGDGGARQGTRGDEREERAPGPSGPGQARDTGAGSRDQDTAPGECLRAAADPATADPTITLDDLTDNIPEETVGPAEGAGSEQVDNEVTLVEEEEVSDTGIGIVTDGSLNSETEREAVGVPEGVSDGTGPRVRPRTSDLITAHRWTRVLARLVWPPHWTCGGLGECLRCVRARLRVNNHQ